MRRMKEIHKKLDDGFTNLINSLLEDPDSVENSDIQADEVESEIAIEAEAVKEYEEFHTIAFAAPQPQLKLQTEVTCVDPVSVDYSQVLFLSKGETEVWIGQPSSKSSVYGMNSLKSWCSGVRLNVAVGFSSNTANPDSENGRQNHYSGFKNVKVIRLELSNQFLSPWITRDDEYAEVAVACFRSLMEHQNGWSKSGAPLRLTWLAKPPPRPPDVYNNTATSRETDGALTLEQMNVSNQIAKLIVLSWIQDSEIGNETTEIDWKYINLESMKIVGFDDHQNSGLLYVSRKIENYKRRWELFPHGLGSITIILSWDVICKLSFIVTPNHGTVNFESLLKLQDSRVGRMIEGGTNELFTWKIVSRNPRFAADIGYLLGDTKEHCSTFMGTRTRAAFVFIIGFWMLGLANNTVQGPARALLDDLSGSTKEWHRWFPFLTSRACCEACGNLKAAFLIAVGFLTFCTLVTVYFARELPLIENQPHLLSDSAPLLDDPHQVGSDNSSMKHHPPHDGNVNVIKNKEDHEMSNNTMNHHHPEGEDQSDVCHDGPGVVLVNLLTTVRHLPHAMHSVLIVMALSWLSWFPFFLFDMDWMGREVYHGDPSGNAAEVKAFDHGVREELTADSGGGQGLAIGY